MAAAIEELKILIVDDNLQARAMIRMMCQAMGIDQMFTANDGKEALDFLGDAADLVNLIICDWRMPRLSGIELLRQIRTVDPAIRFLMLTGLATQDSVAAARDLGVSAYLKKPCSPEQLETRLLTLADGVDE
jgi:CheY-like chemotaxis protein